MARMDVGVRRRSDARKQYLIRSRQRVRLDCAGAFGG
jgi:hypothetical protein